MKDLLNTYSVDQILLFIVLLAAAIKGIVSWIDWARGRGEKIFEKKSKKTALQDSVNNLIQAQENMKNDISNCQIQLKHTIDDIKKAINLLTESDKDDIKAWITEKHHYFCYQIGWIDDYSLDCIEKRYGHYKDEGGNTFIDELMEEIRALPKRSETFLKENSNINR